MIHFSDTNSADHLVFAGIDWGGKHHQVCLVDRGGNILTRKRLRQDVAGFAELDELLDIPGIRVAIERGEGLLVEHLQLRGLPVYCVSPKMSARARERYRLSATKSDAFDAFVLADTLRHEYRHWRPLPVLSAHTAELKAVIRDRERINWSQRSAESQLRAILEAYHPAPLHLFSTLDRDITLDFLADYPTPAQAGRVGTARMEAFCHRHGYSGRVPADQLIERIRPHLLSASPGTTRRQAAHRPALSGATALAQRADQSLRQADRPAARHPLRCADLPQLPRDRPGRRRHPDRRDG